MVRVLFADLSRTIDIKHGEVNAETPLWDIISSYAEDWKAEDITIAGKPISSDDLCKTARELSKPWKNFTLQIEKH